MCIEWSKEWLPSVRAYRVVYENQVYITGHTNNVLLYCTIFRGTIQWFRLAIMHTLITSWILLYTESYTESSSNLVTFVWFNVHNRVPSYTCCNVNISCRYRKEHSNSVFHFALLQLTAKISERFTAFLSIKELNKLCERVTCFKLEWNLIIL